MLSLKLQKVTGPLPTSVFDLLKDSEIVGLVQVRHKPSAGIGVPKEFASHIYYEINDNYQKRGFGTEALRLALIESRNLGLNKVVLTCDEDNVASKKIIEKNDGILMDKCKLDDNKSLFKYEINLC